LAWLVLLEVQTLTLLLPWTLATIMKLPTSMGKMLSQMLRLGKQSPRGAPMMVLCGLWGL
jgi:hypothetical protein